MPFPRFLLVPALAAVAALTFAVPSADARGRPVRAADPAVTVDVSRLRQLGAAEADLVRASLEGEFARSGVAPQPGTRLVVQIIGLSLNSYDGQSGGGGGGDGGGGSGTGTPNDYLEGVTLVVGPGGQVLSRHPQLLAVPASSGGAYYLPGSESRRVVAISRYYAEWVKRALG